MSKHEYVSHPSGIGWACSKCGVLRNGGLGDEYPCEPRGIDSFEEKLERLDWQMMAASVGVIPGGKWLGVAVQAVPWLVEYAKQLRAEVARLREENARMARENEHLQCSVYDLVSTPRSLAVEAAGGGLPPAVRKVDP